MKIRILSLIISVLLLATACSCGKQKQDAEETTAAETSVAEQTKEGTTESEYLINPLTGVQNLNKSAKDKRPVAVMINNISTAQKVQCGVGDADIVYETMVEGGITRLMAVFSDISSVGQLGTVRSARYSYADLACGLDAVYVHCGSDNKYATPHMRELSMDDIDLGGNGASAGERISNGLAYEHTLYTYGNKLANIYEKGRTEIKSRAQNIYEFNGESSPVKYDKAATDVKVSFSGSYKSTFTYDTETNKYIRGYNGNKLTDYKTGKYERFKNILILYTDVYELSDNYHVKSELKSGSGMYISEGTATEIKWSKGGASDALVYKTTDGEKLKLNAGNSYVCITSSSNKSATSIS